MRPESAGLPLKDIWDCTAALTLRDIRDGRYSGLRSLSQCPTRSDQVALGHPYSQRFAKRLAPQLAFHPRTQKRKFGTELLPEQDSNLRPTA